MRLTTPICALLALACLSSPLLQAQERLKLGPRSFFPADYETEFYVDMDALQDSDFWDTLERSLVVGPMFAMFRSEFGIRLRDMKLIRGAGKRIKVEDGGERECTVAVFESLRPLELPKPRKDESDYNRRVNKKVAGFDVVQQGTQGSWRVPEMFVLPRPGCLVYGDKELIQSVLEGRRRGGVPSAQLMAFTAGRKPLAYFAMSWPDEGDHLRGGPFPAAWFTDDDPIRFFMIRLKLDPKTEHAIVSMHLRFAEGKKGPSLFEDGLKTKLEDFAKDKRFAIVKKAIEQLVVKRDGQDVRVSLDMGDAKLTVGLLGLSSVFPWFFLSAEDAVAVPVAVDAPAVPVPVREEPEKKDVKKDVEKEKEKKKEK